MQLVFINFLYQKNEGKSERSIVVCGTQMK